MDLDKMLLAFFIILLAVAIVLFIIEYGCESRDVDSAEDSGDSSLYYFMFITTLVNSLICSQIIMKYNRRMRVK